MELDPQLMSVGPGSRTGRNKTLSRRAERHSSKAVESLAPEQINSELQNYILCAPASMVLQVNSIPFAIVRVTYLFPCVILSLFNIVNASQCHEHISLTES